MSALHAIEASRVGDVDWGELLREFDVLAGLDRAAREEILSEALVRDLDYGDTLIRLGAPNRSLYLVLEGKLGVFRQAMATEPVAVVEAGQTVGELSVLERRPAPASVMALEASRVVVFSETAFWRLIDASHAFAARLLKQVSERPRGSDETFTRGAPPRTDYERAAMYDAATAVYNRPWADETIEELAKRDVAFSVVRLEVDDFEKVGAEHGRAASDVLLAKLAALLTRTLRGTDYVARYGSEEFILILPEAKAESAAMVAERVRRALAAVAFETKDGTVLPRVTISAGAAQHETGQGAAELVAQAGAALARAKEAGRNRVERV